MVTILMSVGGRRLKPVYGGFVERGPDAAELRAWVTDEAELGKRVADDFISVGRCYAGTLDKHIFDLMRRRFPDPADAPKWSAPEVRRG